MNRLRRRWRARKAKNRCSFCPLPSVWFRQRRVFDDPTGNTTHETIRYCNGHAAKFIDNGDPI